VTEQSESVCGMKEIYGIIPVLATPFDEFAEIDLDAFESEIHVAVHEGADALAMFGLASEYYKLTDHERADLLHRLVRVAGSRTPIVVSVSHHATEVAMRQAREAQDAGASAVMILPPFFLDPSLEAILEHVECIVETIEIPCILQYAPAQTKITPEILARVPVSIIKIDAVPYAPAAATVPADRTRLAGYMGLDLPCAIAAGCDGCMPTASLVPQFKRLWRLLQDEPEAGRDYHARLLPLLQFMMKSIEFLIACEKQLLVRRNIIKSCNSRRPMAQLQTEEIRALDRYFSEL
jgi:2-keto-3-deoxy-L-arabinonate dehydratase